MKDSINSNANISSTPMQCVNIGELGITLTTNEEFLNNLSYKNFVPYTYYNNENDSIEAYFKDDSCYTKHLNDKIELFLSSSTGDIVGINILNVSKLINSNENN